MSAKLRLDEYGIWVHDHSKRKRRFEVLERRRVVRRAFLIIRYNPDHKAKVLLFAKALSGKIDLTDDLLRDAWKVISDQGHDILQ